ncbi:hypothetical protein [Tenacibaculum aestuarii]|uniref:hypothetical protein n=1 Tax=Tenacibaculum aestuarii TaxID=362781 RepID=UPI003895D1D2
MNYSIEDKVLPNIKKNTFWIITWIETNIYYKGQKRLGVYLRNFKSSTLIIDNILEKKAYIELPGEWLNKIHIGYAFNSRGESIMGSEIFLKKYKYTYSHLSQESYDSNNDRYLSMQLLSDFGYPIPLKKLNGFKYYRLLLNNFLVIVPEYILLQHFYFHGVSSDVVLSILENRFYDDLFIKIDIEKTNKTKLGHIIYNNDVLEDYDTKKLSLFQFLKNGSGKNSIKEIGASSNIERTNYFRACLPFDSEITFSLEGIYLKKSDGLGINNIFFAMKVSEFNITEKHMINVDKIFIHPKVEKNSTKKRNEKEKKAYRGKVFKSSVPDNSPIIDSPKSNAPKDDKKLDSFFNSFEINIPIEKTKRNDQKNQWVKENIDIITSNETSYSTSSDTSNNSNSKGINASEQQTNENLEDLRSFNSFYDIINELNHFKDITGSYISLDSTNKKENYLTLNKKKVKYYLFKIKKGTDYFYLIKFPQTYTKYIGLFYDFNKKEIKKDLNLVIKQCSSRGLNLWLLKRRKSLSKIGIELHNFTCVLPNNEIPKLYISRKIKEYIDKL